MQQLQGGDRQQGVVWGNPRLPEMGTKDLMEEQMQNQDLSSSERGGCSWEQRWQERKY